MASTGAELVPTLAQMARLTGADGEIAAVVAELMYQSNEFIPRLYWQEANQGTAELVQQRVGLPTVYYRGINQGIPSSTNEYAAITEASGMAQGISTIDAKLLKINNARKNWEFLNKLGFVESLCENFAKTFFYGDTTITPDQFMGLGARYNTLLTANAASAANVINGGGSANANSSLWLLNSGPRSMYGFFPKGTAAGIQYISKKNDAITITAGMGQTTLLGDRDIYEWDAGIALPDWRWNARIANVDSNNLSTQSGAANLLELMIDAIYKVPSIGIPASDTGNSLTSIAMTGQTFFVCNRRVRAALHKQAISRANQSLSLDEVAGKKMLTFLGIPILNCDQLLTTEANVV